MLLLTHKKYNLTSCIILWMGIFLFGCDEPIDVETEPADPTLVVDGFINDLNEEQLIVLNFSQDYFDNAAYVPATGAVVTVTEEGTNQTYPFAEKADEPGTYAWQPPSATETFGTLNGSYNLSIVYEGEAFGASSSMNRVPTVDSILFTREEGFFGADDFFQAEFFARDFEGFGDTYWIKTFKNGEFLNRPSEINIAYDAAFDAGGQIDGLIFIPPIRSNINELDDDGDIVEYLPASESFEGDLVKVELHAITNETHDYLNQLLIQTNRPGGFAELFAEPIANLRTNVEVVTPGSSTAALGFFSVSSVSSLEVRFTEDLLRDD